MDEGPVIAQGAVPILAGDSADDLAQRVLAVEHQIYARALAKIAGGPIEATDSKNILISV
jgi:phosphoribosylglycinamide formyltransferase 1